MSKCAHSQSTYKLRELPKCSRCKKQFQLVKASYKTATGKTILVDEWECQRCSKIVPFNNLKEGKIFGDEKFFYQKAQELRNGTKTKIRNRKKNNK